MSIKSIWALIFVIMCAACTQKMPDNADSRAVTHGDTRSEYQKVALLMSVVKAKGGSVWIEYHNVCALESPDIIRLELAFNSDNMNGKADALSSVQDLLRDNKGVSVSELRPGVIGVRSDGVWLQALQAKVVDLKLRDIDRYNPDAAIGAAMEASELSLKDMHARPAEKICACLQEEPFPKRPHLSASAKYGTLEDLLEDLTRTFGGVLVYKECRQSDGSHVIDIDFDRTDEFAFPATDSSSE